MGAKSPPSQGRHSRSHGRKPRQHRWRAKKIPTDEGWDFRYWWSRRESNPRPRVFCDQFYVCSDVIEISLPLRRRTGSTSNQPPEF